MAALYDSIGRTYTSRRQTDPRIAAAIEDALDGCTSILNVGAGAGSYEPQTRSVVALEPSRTMIAQRLATAAPVVQGRAEALPFTDGSFDAVLGVLTVHHWKDQMMGLAECARVARSRIVILTYDLEVSARFWLFDYLPELLRIDRLVFPPMEKFIDAFGSIESRVIPIRLPRRFLGRVLAAAACLPGSAGSLEHFYFCQNWQHRFTARVSGARHRFRRVAPTSLGLARHESD